LLQEPSLKKTIGFWSATALATGTMIGSGIFMNPASMAAELGSPLWLAAVWVLAGVFSLFGALVFSELGALMPETGGLYVYFRYMYGNLVAFLYGWAAFAVINTASVAAIAFVCAQYANYFLHLPRFDAATEHAIVWYIPFIGRLYPLENFGVKSLAIVLVMAFTFLNYRSTRASSRLQVVSTAVKFGVLGALVLGIFFSGNGSFQHLVSGNFPTGQSSLMGSIAAAMTGAFFAYDGWIGVSFVAGEIQEPQKNIPRSLLVAVLACIALYLFVNEAYLYALSIRQMAASSLVASDAIAAALGTTTGGVIAALIVVCTFGAINGSILGASRVTFAMGRNRTFFQWAGREQPRFHTPGNALWLHGLWTVLFIVSGSFDMLTDMMVFISWLAYLGGAVGLFVLRRKWPDAPRAYKVWGYPVVPFLFIIFSSFYLVFTVVNDVQQYRNGNAPVVNSLLGVVITLVGVPLYLYFRNRRKVI